MSRNRFKAEEIVSRLCELYWLITQGGTEA